MIKYKDSLGFNLLGYCEQFSAYHALWVDDHYYSYDQLAYLAKQVVGIMPSHNCPVALMASQSLSAYVGIWSSLFNGSYYVPLNKKWPRERLSYVIKQSDVRVVIIDKAFESQAQELFIDEHLFFGLTLIFLEHDEVPSWVDSTGYNGISRIDIEKIKNNQWQYPEYASQYVYLMFTSGTTGQPKGIGITHSNLSCYAQSIHQYYQFNHNDRFAHLCELTFDVSVHDLISCWPVGGCLYAISDTVKLIGLDRFIRKHRITCWSSVPALLSYMNRLNRLKANSLPSLKWSSFCGEPLPVSLATQWANSAPNSRIYNLYGPTEATIAITIYEFCVKENDHNQIAYVPIGKPLGDQEIIIVDQQSEQPVSPDQSGELWVSGSQLCDGYWSNPQKTQSSFVESNFNNDAVKIKRWYRTGDRVQYNDYGDLIFLGRLDFQVKINGYRIELPEIETVIQNNMHCDWVVVLPFADNKQINLFNRLALFICGSSIEKESVIACCQKHLPAYMVPDQVFIVDETPYNANGKVDRNALSLMLPSV